MFYSVLSTLYEYEISFNRNIQKQFQFAEPFLRLINEYLDPNFIINLWIPFVGAFSHKLLVQLAASLGLINTLASVIKWCSPEYRPIWWIKENANNFKYNFKDIKNDPYSCDTSAGFPSSHAVAFTAFILLVTWRCVKSFTSSVDLVLWDWNVLIYTIISVLSVFLWTSRLYFLYEFLHQCLISSLLAAVMLNFCKRNSRRLLHIGKLKALLLVIGLGLIPISVYFVMLYIDEDPFWSVRMAFKWCADPLHLKHESSPVFILCRDFGYIMGVALSCPLAKSYRKATNNYRQRLLLLFIVEMINAGALSYTPKQYGRFIFVAFEFLRNCLHSFLLLTILPKFNKK